MANSSDITVTDYRLRKAMTSLNDDDFTRQAKKLGEDLKSELKPRIGRVIEICPDTDTAKVITNGTTKTETCLIAHDIFSEGMNINGYPKGSVEIKHKQTFIVPSENLYGIIITAKDGDREKNILLSFINYTSWNRSDNATNGEYRIHVGDNVISITDQYMNIKSDNLVINGLPYTEAYKPLDDYHDKEEINQIVNPYIEDTGWKDLEMMDGFINHSEKDKAQYRRIGKTVQIRGALKNTSAYTPAYDGDKIAQITDKTCYPSQRITTLQQGTGANRMMVMVDTDGAVIVGRYGTSGVGQINGNSWLNIQTMYFVD